MGIYVLVYNSLLWVFGHGPMWYEHNAWGTEDE